MVTPSEPPVLITADYLAQILRIVVTSTETRAIVEVMRIHGVLVEMPRGLDLVKHPGATRKVPREAAQLLFNAFYSLVTKPPFVKFAKLIDRFTPASISEGTGTPQGLPPIIRIPRAKETPVPAGKPKSPKKSPAGANLTTPMKALPLAREWRLRQEARERDARQEKLREELDRLVWERADTIAEFGAAADPYGALLVDQVISRARAAHATLQEPPKAARLHDRSRRLTLDVDQCIVGIDGEDLAVGPAGARVLKRLIEAQAKEREAWTTRKALKEDPTSSERVERVLDDLPPQVRGFIERKRGLGCRLRVE